MDELYGILTAYELRLGIDNTSKGEASFKVTKKTINQRKNTQTGHNEEHDLEEANFINKLQKGFRKYKGKIPFKCFNCGKIGHFQSKCPYPKKDYKDEMKKVNNTRKKENLTIRKSTKKKGTTIQKNKKKTTVHLRLVTVMMRSFF